MNANKILLGGIVGGVASFLLGWLVYGVLFMDYMNANYNQCAMKPMEEMVWWALILSNFASGFLLAIIFSWSNTRGLMAGAKVAGIVAFFMITSYDLSFYSMSSMFSGLSVVIVDIVIGTVFTAHCRGIDRPGNGNGKERGVIVSFAYSFPADLGLQLPSLIMWSTTLICNYKL